MTGAELYHPAAQFMTDVRDALPDTNFSVGRVYVDQDADDHALVARCLDGDQTAFEAIVDRYQRVLFTVALRTLGDRDEAADATQNAFVKAYFKLHTFDSTRRFFSWIYRILVNECLNMRRDRRFHEPVTPEHARVGSVAEVFEASERKQRVQAAIRSLPAVYREVIVLRHFGGLSYGAIADALGVETKTVKSRLYTARERLAELLGLDGRP
jgi:RNA polymerase sigma-70 factor, ECF subfamily